MAEISSIELRPTGEVAAYLGPDAVEFASVRLLRVSLIAWAEHQIIPFRGMTISRMLEMCRPYTGRTYKRSETFTAVADLEVWLKNMAAGLPITVREP